MPRRSLQRAANIERKRVCTLWVVECARKIAILCGAGRTQSAGGVQANKKERDKAKKERKEARKLAENPLQPITEDAVPRPYLNDGERQETLQWIEDRKSSYPTRARIATAAANADALDHAGARALIFHSPHIWGAGHILLCP